MNQKYHVSDDGRVILALCSAFGLSTAETASGLEPLKPSEWNRLARALEQFGQQRPASLLELSASELSDGLHLDPPQAEQIRRLLDRAAHLGPALDEIFEADLWFTTRADESYPARLRATLKEKSPPVLFGAGQSSLLDRASVAVVGSRNIDESGAAFATRIGGKGVDSGLAVVSGGARGTDRIAMNAALEAGGISIGALADSLLATVRKAEVRQLLSDGRLVLVTPYSPEAGFSVGAAMGRNKIIYGLADFAVVVSSDYQTGGTWAGAVEALKANWCPLFVREGPNAPQGNRELIKLGGIGLSDTELAEVDDLRKHLKHRAKPKAVEQDLF